MIAGKAAYSFTGTVQGGNFAAKTLWVANVSDGFCGVADFNADKKPEVVLVSNAKIYALNGQTGVVKGSADIPNGGKGGTPNIADFDGDGQPEIAAAGSTAYIVYKYDGNATFTKLWSAVTKDTSSQVTGSSVFDFDGDGRNEVVYNDEQYIRIYPGVEPDCLKNPKGPACDGNMTDAEVIFRDLNTSRTRTEYPVIADVDGNFKAEIVFPLAKTRHSRRSAAIPRIRAFWRGSPDHPRPPRTTARHRVWQNLGKSAHSARACQTPIQPFPRFHSHSFHSLMTRRRLAAASLFSGIPRNRDTSHS